MESKSYEKIHYGLRPAKCVERKMLCEAFRRLSVFGKVENYRYIGLGSLYFTDFCLFHKALGITNMISIEQHEEDRARFEFNKPFKCIEIIYDTTHAVLPSLEWDVRTILWLDYDSKLDKNMLADIKCFFTNAIPGSVIVVTVNVHPDKYEYKRSVHPDKDEDENEHEPTVTRLERLKERLGEKVPYNVKEKDLAGWGLARVSYRVITNEISETLYIRNGGRAPGTNYLYKQLFHFLYADGAKMLTVGGLLYDEGQTALADRCEFDALPFFRPGEDAYKIQVPLLTFREIRHLDAQLPVQNLASLDAPAIPEKDRKNYAELYRFFPSFTEAEI